MKKKYWGVLSGGEADRPLTEDQQVIEFCEALAQHHSAELYCIGSQQTIDLAVHSALPPPAVQYPDYESLIIDPHVQFVFIDTPIEVRTSLIKACLNYKKHVLCVPPLGLDPVEVAEVLALSKKTGYMVVESLNAYFLPPLQRIMGLIAQGGIGDIRHVQATASHQAPTHGRQQDVYHDIGVQPLALAIRMLQAPEEIVGQIKPNMVGRAEEYALLWRYPNQQSALLFASLSMHDGQHAHIYGSKARAHLHAPFYGKTRVSIYDKQRQSGLMKFNYLHEPYYYVIEAVQERQAKGDVACPEWSHDCSLQLVQSIARIQKDATWLLPNA